MCGGHHIVVIIVITPAVLTTLQSSSSSHTCSLHPFDVPCQYASSPLICLLILVNLALTFFTVTITKHTTNVNCVCAPHTVSCVTSLWRMHQRPLLRPP